MSLKIFDEPPEQQKKDKPELNENTKKDSRFRRILTNFFLFLIIYIVLGPFIKHGLRYVSLEIDHQRGHGWEIVRHSLEKQIAETYHETPDQGVPPSFIAPIAKCVADKYIPVLNKSTCRVVGSSDCMNSPQLVEQFRTIQLTCFKEKIPNSYEAFQELFAQDLLEQVKESKRRDITAESMHVVVSCAAHKYATKLDELNRLKDLKCGPLNLDADTIETLVVHDACNLVATAAVHVSGYLGECAKIHRTDTH